jgi:hypothetical protein
MFNGFSKAGWYQEAERLEPEGQHWRAAAMGEWESEQRRFVGRAAAAPGLRARRQEGLGRALSQEPACGSAVYSSNVLDSFHKRSLNFKNTGWQEVRAILV